MGNLGVKKFKFLKMDQNWFYLIEQASDMSKIKLSFMHVVLIKQQKQSTN